MDHLVNPMLINELAEKLPSATKLEWVRYNRKQNDVPLCTFSDFISEIVSEATEATLLTSLAADSQNMPRNNKKRMNDHGFLNTHVGVEYSANPSINNRSQNNSPFSFKPFRGCGRIDHRTRYCEDFKRMNGLRLRRDGNYAKCVKMSMMKQVADSRDAAALVVATSDTMPCSISH